MLSHLWNFMHTWSLWGLRLTCRAFTSCISSALAKAASSILASKVARAFAWFWIRSVMRVSAIASCLWLSFRVLRVSARQGWLDLIELTSLSISASCNQMSQLELCCSTVLICMHLPRWVADRRSCLMNQTESSSCSILVVFKHCRHYVYHKPQSTRLLFDFWNLSPGLRHAKLYVFTEAYTVSTCFEIQSFAFNSFKHSGAESTTRQDAR